jgi:hypothetical protein
MRHLQGIGSQVWCHLFIQQMCVREGRQTSGADACMLADSCVVPFGLGAVSVQGARGINVVRCFGCAEGRC